MKFAPVRSVLFLSILISIGCPKKQKTFEIMKYQSCSEYPDLPIMVQTNRKKNLKNNRTLDMNLTAKREIGGVMEGKISLWKCDLSGSADSCEYYVKDLKIKKLCEKIPMKNQAWTPFVEGFKPPLDCPIKAGTYVVDCPVNDDIFRFLPVPTGIWKAKGYMYSNDELVTCIDFDSRVMERLNKK